MSKHRPFQLSIDTLALLVAEPATPLNVHVRTWVNSEVNAQKLADLEASQATEQGREILRTFASLSGRQYHVCCGGWEAEGADLDTLGEELLKMAIKTAHEAATKREQDVAELRGRIRDVTELLGDSVH